MLKLGMLSKGNSLAFPQGIKLHVSLPSYRALTVSTLLGGNGERWLGQVGGHLGGWVEGHERQVGDSRDRLGGRWRTGGGTGRGDWRTVGGIGKRWLRQVGRDRGRGG